MERMTNDRTAQELKENIRKLKSAGIEVDASNERYVRLAEYEAAGLSPGQIAELIDKHWEECRQIALYDNELRQAVELLSECYGALNALGTLAPSLPRDVQDYIEEVCIRIDSLREETASTTEVQSNE